RYSVLEGVAGPNGEVETPFDLMSFRLVVLTHLEEERWRKAAPPLFFTPRQCDEEMTRCASTSSPSSLSAASSHSSRTRVCSPPPGPVLLKRIRTSANFVPRGVVALIRTFSPCCVATAVMPSRLSEACADWDTVSSEA